MNSKRIVYSVAIAAATYAAIYFYQRYKRAKADENVTDAKEAEEIINNL